MNKSLPTILSLSVLLLLGASCVPAEEVPGTTTTSETQPPEPMVSVLMDDQEISTIYNADMGVEAKVINVSKVKSENGGWLVLFTSNEGDPVKFLGNNYVAPGTQENVPITIAMQNTTEIQLDQVKEMVVVLYRDEGTPNRFEYGTSDTPYVSDSGAPIKDPFKIL